MQGHTLPMIAAAALSALVLVPDIADARVVASHRGVVVGRSAIGYRAGFAHWGIGYRGGLATPFNSYGYASGPAAYAYGGYAGGAYGSFASAYGYGFLNPDGCRIDWRQRPEIVFQDRAYQQDLGKNC